MWWEIGLAAGAAWFLLGLGYVVFNHKAAQLRKPPAPGGAGEDPPLPRRVASRTPGAGPRRMSAVALFFTCPCYELRDRHARQVLAEYRCPAHPLPFSCDWEAEKRDYIERLEGQ
jgi:hypothetical protein